MTLPTVAALYNQFYSSTTVGKQRFVETFNANDLDTNIWNKVTISGSPTFAMADTIDSGFVVTAPTNASSDQGGINFNDIKPFSNTSATFICITQIGETTLMKNEFGLIGTFSAFNGGTGNGVLISADSSNDPSNFELQSFNGGIETTTSTAFALNTSFNKFNISVGSSNMIAKVNGANTTTNSTNLPTTALQPWIRCSTRTTSARHVYSKYLEVYNQ